MSNVAQVDFDVIHTTICYKHDYINAYLFEWVILLTTHLLLGVLCGQPSLTMMLYSTPMAFWHGHKQMGATSHRLTSWHYAWIHPGYSYFFCMNEILRCCVFVFQQCPRLNMGGKVALHLYVDVPRGQLGCLRD